MVLPFKEIFIPKILNGQKIHTIREDKHERWKAGNSIQMATGVRTANYNCFFTEVCMRVQKIEIRGQSVYIENELISDRQICLLAFNDGFNSAEEFFEWFHKDFTGKIIHWTNYKY